MAIKPRYFCENCGSEVDRGASSCPSCGSRFTAVRCPKCSYEGREAEFRAGCPVCGYLVPQTARPTSPPPQRAQRKGSSLPGWFYRAAAIALLAAVVVLLVVILARG